MLHSVIANSCGFAYSCNPSFAYDVSVLTNVAKHDCIFKGEKVQAIVISGLDINCILIKNRLKLFDVTPAELTDDDLLAAFRIVQSPEKPHCSALVYIFTKGSVYQYRITDNGNLQSMSVGYAIDDGLTYSYAFTTTEELYTLKRSAWFTPMQHADQLKLDHPDLLVDFINFQ